MGAVLTAAGLTAAGCADMGPRPTATAVAGRCADQRFPIYFAPNSADIQPESQAVIRAALNRTGGCRVTAVEVVGVALAEPASRQSDPTLTGRRTEAVAGVLARPGLPAPTFDVQTANGPTPARGVRAPLARRTEVVLHVQPG